MNERGRSSATLMMTTPGSDETEVSTAAEPGAKDDQTKETKKNTT